MDSSATHNPSIPQNIVLMGLRGSGKSTLGQSLAVRLGCAFVDLDELTAARLGCVDVPEAWSRCGPEAFRKAETEALQEVIRHAHQVIALGGGTPTAPGAEGVLLTAMKTGTTRLVYLRATPATLRTRLSLTDTSSRPSLTGGGVIDEVQRVFDVRDPRYLELASDVLEVDGLREDESLARLMMMLA